MIFRYRLCEHAFHQCLAPSSSRHRFDTDITWLFSTGQFVNGFAIATTVGHCITKRSLDSLDAGSELSWRRAPKRHLNA